MNFQTFSALLPPKVWTLFTLFHYRRYCRSLCSWRYFKIPNHANSRACPLLKSMYITLCTLPCYRPSVLFPKCPLKLLN